MRLMGRMFVSTVGAIVVVALAGASFAHPDTARNAMALDHGTERAWQPFATLTAT